MNKIKKTANKYFGKKNYAKTMGTVSKWGGRAANIATAAAIYSNPALAGTFAAFKVGKLAANYLENKGDKYFKNKTGKYATAYRSARDVVNASTDMALGDFVGAAGNYAHLVGDTGLLNKDSQRKFDNFSTNYMDPTIEAAGAVQSVSKIRKVTKKK